MSISFDNSANWSSPDSSGANTLSYVMGSVTNGILIVAAQTAGTITGVTYNGVSLTKLLDSPNTLISYYYLQNPSSGTNNIVLTRSGTNTNGVQGEVMSFSGVKQSGNPFTSLGQFTTTATTSASNNVTTTVANSYIIDFVDIQSSPLSGVNSLTATGTGHVGAAYGYSGGGTQEGNGSGYTPTTTTGSYSVGYSWTTIASAATVNFDYYQMAPATTSPGTMTNVSTMTNISTITI